MVNKIICLSGIPGMGKSTYAQTLGIHRVDVDRIEDEGGFFGNILFLLDDFVIDWIFLFASERTTAVKDLRVLYPSATLELHWFKPDFDLIVARRGYELDRAKRFVDMYEIPTYAEGWDVIKEVINNV